MSIAARVKEAVAKMQLADAEGALHQICSAVDATAQAEYGQRGRRAYQRFLHDNMSLITRVAFGNRAILNMNVQYAHPDIEPAADGLCSLEQIIYHAIRCGLYHGAGLPSNLRFIPEAKILVEGSDLVLPAPLIYGFILAVVLSPTNSRESIAESGQPDDVHGVNVFGLSLRLNRLWGKRHEFTWLLEAIV